MPNWNDILNEIGSHKLAAEQAASSAQDIVRRKHLWQLHEHTHRNVIAYYSGWLSKPKAPSPGINDEDKNGFMTAVHQLDRSKGLDLILHTPGGDMAATESIVFYLRKMFGRDIRAIVPQIAMSAGTMIACCCKEILMGQHSCLGPIDPQLAGLPALGVKKEFERAFREIKADPDKLAIWEPILRKYHPTFLTQCESAVDWAQDFVETQLREAMLYRKKGGAKKAKDIVAKLLDFDANKAHQRHIHIDEAAEIGLKVQELEKDQKLQDLVLTVHHCYIHATQNTNAYKMVENHLGIAVVKQQALKVQQIAVPS